MQNPKFLNPAVRVVQAEDDGGSIASAFRDKFPSLFAFPSSSGGAGADDDGDSGQPVEDKASPKRSSQSASDDDNKTGNPAEMVKVMISDKADYARSILKMIGAAGGGAVFLSLVNPALNKITKWEDNTKKLTDATLGSIKSKVTDIASALNSAFSFLKTGMIKGATTVIKDKMGTFSGYYSTIQGLKLTKDQTSIFRAAAIANDGKKFASEYPFSTMDALTEAGLKQWYKTYDTEYAIFLRALVEAFGRVPKPHAILVGSYNHWLAFSLAFANVESNFTLTAKNLSDGGVDETDGSFIKRKGAFGAFQIRWTNVITIFKANPTLFAGKTYKDFDSDLSVQALVWALLLNEAIALSASAWLTRGAAGEIEWSSPAAEEYIGHLMDYSGSFGPTPSGVLTSLVNLALAVGPVTPATNPGNPKGFKIKLAAAEKAGFRNNLKQKNANTALFELALISGMPLGGFAKLLQTAK